MSAVAQKTQSIDQASEAIKSEIDRIESWNEKTRYLIGLGMTLTAADPVLMVEENRIVGCQSRVWIAAETYSTTDTLTFKAYSDSMLMRGIAALVLKIYNGRSSNDVLGYEGNVLAHIGVDEYLAPGRSNGLRLLIDRVRAIAQSRQATD